MGVIPLVALSNEDHTWFNAAAQSSKVVRSFAFGGSATDSCSSWSGLSPIESNVKCHTSNTSAREGDSQFCMYLIINNENKNHTR